MIHSETVSIIVPVFNAEKYIEQCIKSCLDQSYKDIELILVNDGSTDGSLEKCLPWKTDPRVQIVSIENHGVSFARNLGLRRASGKWILFLDSDDYLLENCLEKLMSLVSADTQQIIAAYTEGEVKKAELCHQTVSADEISRLCLDPINHRFQSSFYEEKPASWVSCWNKLYLNRVIQENAIAFCEGLRLSEDMLFNMDYLSCIRQAVITNIPVVFYRSNAQSVTRAFHPSHLDDRMRLFRILKDREYENASVYIISTLFWEICRMESETSGNTRKQLEKIVCDYFSENKEILLAVRNLSLSNGKWQRMVYEIAAICFRYKVYCVGFFILRLYALAIKEK